MLKNELAIVSIQLNKYYSKTKIPALICTYYELHCLLRYGFNLEHYCLSCWLYHV